MTPERWARLTELFEAAVERQPGDRPAFLAAACADDAELRREVEQILESHERAGGSGFGESPAFVVTEHRRDGALEAGARLGRYEVVALLGAGGMGEVYRARDPQLGREVGVKIVTSDSHARVEREARAVAALNHPNILAVYDIGLDAGASYVVSELLEGETLRARLQAGALPLDEALDHARQIVAGLTAAHDKGIVHRDIKPENLFVTSGGVVKILDFGLARHVGAAVEGTGAMGGGDQSVPWGTAGYMSPEQMRGQPADARSDIFAVGAVLYELLTGRRAFPGDSPADRMHLAATGAPANVTALRPEVPAAIARAVRRCLEKDPARRFASMRELAAALERRPAWMVTSHPATQQPSYLVAAALLALAAGGVALGLRPAAPAPGASGRPAVAVARFADRTADPALAWLADGLPSMLVTSLAQTPGLDVTTTGTHDASRAAMGGTLLAGSFVKAGDDVRVDVELRDASSGRVLAATGEAGRDVFTIVDVLAARVRETLQVEDRPAGRRLRDVTTESLSAYELYVRALDASRNVRRGDARTMLEEALRIDPAFAMARVQLALVLEQLREPVEAGAHRRAVALDRLPERQRLLVEAKREFDVNPARARAIAERLIERYPDEEEAYDLIVHTMTYTRSPERREALAFMQRWARAIPGPGSGHFHNHYGYVLIDNGLFAEAEQEFRAYIQVDPQEANPYDSLAELFLITSRPAEAIEHYNQALRRNPLFGASYWGRAYAEAMLGRYDEAIASVATLDELGTRSGLPAATIHLENAFIRSRAGRYREADAHLAAAARVTKGLGDAASEVDGLYVAAVIAIERSDRTRLAALLRQAGDLVRTMPVDLMQQRRRAMGHLLQGLFEARAGRLAAARDALAALQAVPDEGDDVMRAWRQSLAGEIALADGRLDDADAAFRAGEYRVPPSFSILPVVVVLNNNVPFRDGPARVRAARGDFAGAAAIYRRLAEPDIASPWTDVADPRFVLAAARLSARAGDRQAAAHEYTRFLALWKDADASLPELAEARRFLSTR